MTRNLTLVAALLIVNLAGIAAAAEYPDEHKSKNARKLIATLDSIGVNNQEVMALISSADARVEHNYFYFTEQKTSAGKLSLRYHLGSAGATDPTGGNKRLELHYAPKDSRFQVTARTDSVMITYHIDIK